MKKMISTKHGTRLFHVMLIPIIAGMLYGTTSFSQENRLKLNEKDYFEMRGFNVLAFENAYTGFFFDEKTSGIMLVHHGIRTATGGAVRLKPTPEQWDQIPSLEKRTVNKEDNSVEVTLRYEEYNFDSRIQVRAEESSFLIRVFLDQPLPEAIHGRAGLNLEFLPSTYFEKTYLADGTTGIFPLYPSNSMQAMPMSTQLRQFAGHSTFNDMGREEYVEPEPFAQGRTLILAPEDPAARINIQSLEGGDLLLLDGRSVAQNGWFVVRTLLPANATGKVVEWRVTPSVIPNWIRAPVIGYSQVGYHPDQEKVAVIELDMNDTSLEDASLLRINDQGVWKDVYQDDVEVWGDFYRYSYARFDFSGIKEPGLYKISYGTLLSGPFQIGPHIHDHGWQSTLDVWFPVQMDHMFVNEAYRVWHGTAHLDDARQAPLNHQHFDGYRMGDTTGTKYKPGEHIPGLNIGGWFDAGDFDIRTGSHCNTVMSLVETWERFELKRDETLVDKEKRYVDIHHPDGVPDLLQQIEHGTLALIAQHRAFGRAIPGIIVPNLHQYHHLGDGSTMTDNLVYNPDLNPYQSDGEFSGTPDDRWAFTTRMASNSYSSIAALSAASRALRGYNDALAGECLTAAEKAWKDEQLQPAGADRRSAFFGKSNEIRASLQLFISTQDKEYADHFQELIWTALDERLERIMGIAVEGVPYLGGDYKQRLIPYVEKYRETNEDLFSENPYGVPITEGGWAGNAGIIRWAITNYMLHQYYPDIIGPEYTYRGLNYIYGCHPYSNISFVSGVGVHSKKVAYGSNRADFSFIAGGIVPGILVLKPDYPENKSDWPFFWGENEYVIDISADYIMLVNAVLDLGR